MSCDICSQAFHGKRQPICSSCTKATLYKPRIEQLSILLNKDNIVAEAILRPGNDGVLASLPQDADWDAIATGIKKESTSRLQDEVKLANEKLDLLAERSRQLSKEMVILRDQIVEKRNAARQRQAEIRSAKEVLDDKRQSAEMLDAGFRKVRERVQRVHQRSANAKASLCCTAAMLASLKQETARQKLTGRTMLGGAVVPDLRELGKAYMSASSGPPVDGDEQARLLTNACMDNICRLVTIWSHYLSISTPAEIIIPHNDHPYCAILPLKSSYKRRETFSLPNQTSPSASRIETDNRSAARSRLLHLDRPLAKLAKEDAKAFGLYVEGITLLAWNIAWLCRSQGSTAINTFDDVCDIGRNLWIFYKLAEARVTDAASHARKTGQSDAVKPLSFGIMSHGTVQHSMSGHEGAMLMQSWRLLQPHRLVDKLRVTLLTELTGAEWDVLSEQDYDVEREDELPVLVGGKRARIDQGMSIMSVQANDIAEDKKQEKGWMKIRGRPAPD